MNSSFTAFEGTTLLTRGPIEEVAAAAKDRTRADPGARILVFDDATGRVIDHPYDTAPPVDRPKTSEDPKSGDQPRGRGRPKLGVVSREVTLLPRHWEWLNAQPGGASAALRRLIDLARKADGETRAARRSREAAYRVMTTLAGDMTGYEDALRALFAGDRDGLVAWTATWPIDVRTYALDLAGDLSPRQPAAPTEEDNGERG